MNPVIGEWLTRPGGVVERIRALRSRSGLRHVDIAERLSWPPSKVSKLENGKQYPTEDDLRGWAKVCGATVADTDGLVALLADGERVRVDWLHRSGQEAQVDHDRLAQAADVIRNYESYVIPGLLQMEDYMTAVVANAYDLLGKDPVEVAKVVEGRQARQAVLRDTAKQFEFVISEAALLSGVASASVMRAQLYWLLTKAEAPNIRIGVVPQRPGLQANPMNGFIIYGDSVVTEHAKGEDHSEKGSSTYEVAVRAMDRYWFDAVEGEQARDLIQRAANLLR